MYVYIHAIMFAHVKYITAASLKGHCAMHMWSQIEDKIETANIFFRKPPKWNGFLLYCTVAVRMSVSAAARLLFSAVAKFPSAMPSLLHLLDAIRQSYRERILYRHQTMELCLTNHGGLDTVNMHVVPALNGQR